MARSNNSAVDCSHQLPAIHRYLVGTFGRSALCVHSSGRVWQPVSKPNVVITTAAASREREFATHEADHYV